MKKRIIAAATFTACLALCAAVWPQKQPAGETPALPTPAAVIATQPEVQEIPETEGVISPEEEKAEAILPELVEEADILPEPSPAQTPSASEVPVLPETGCHTPTRTSNLPRLRPTRTGQHGSTCQASAG